LLFVKCGPTIDNLKPVNFQKNLRANPYDILHGDVPCRKQVAMEKTKTIAAEIANTRIANTPRTKPMKFSNAWAAIASFAGVNIQKPSWFSGLRQMIVCIARFRFFSNMKIGFVSN